MPEAERPVTWRALLDEAAEVLGSALDARRIVERASGHDGAALATNLDAAAGRRAASHAKAMVERRARGEPLQYVVGSWGFRRLDLFVDRRVLIPRPETEIVVEVAIAAARAAGADGHAPVLADLGTGSGAIALSLAIEVEGAAVWATDSSPGALAVARANLAGIGRPARNVRLLEGDWFDPLPRELRGRVDVAVANPPYVAESDELPSEVADWEPLEALVAGPSGLESIARIVADAPAWLTPAGALVVELAPHQAAEASALARRAGFGHVRVQPDLAGRPRVLEAWRREP